MKNAYVYTDPDTFPKDSTTIAATEFNELENTINILKDRITALEKAASNTTGRFTNIEHEITSVNTKVEYIIVKQNEADKWMASLSETVTVLSKNTFSKNITLLSQPNIATPKSPKTSKRSTPYKKSSYSQVKSYNLRNAMSGEEDTDTTTRTDDEDSISSSYMNFLSGFGNLNRR
ncbi:hypothetical protein C1646_776812 [Rhizophagus diaphanus]|nr:hypothetical protein C1646_776812 [Rhizophagus diaphanus] [Rhizophagus sp. MUCL 43196]